MSETIYENILKHVKSFFEDDEWNSDIESAVQLTIRYIYSGKEPTDA